MIGVYRIGTPLKSSRTPLPVPLRVEVSRSMSSAEIIQSLLPAGQVVYSTSLSETRPSGVTASSCAAPRAGREGTSNSASPNFAPPTAS